MAYGVYKTLQLNLLPTFTSYRIELTGQPKEELIKFLDDAPSLREMF